MANWITHTRMADRLLEMGLPVDETYFIIGSVAPDCNQENEDWTSYIPPREQTHFMQGKSKLTVDAEGFFEQHVKHASTPLWKSFCMGYYVHLVMDRAWQRWIRDEKRVAASFCRLKAVPERTEKLQGYPETYDTLKQVFGRAPRIRDVERLEQMYVQQNPFCSYERILRKTHDFPDVPGFLPNAVNRKITVMAPPIPDVPIETDFLFFAPEEYEQLMETAVLEAWQILQPQTFAEECLFETERMKIRPFRMEDAETLFRNHQEEEMKRWIPNESYQDVQEAEEAIRFYKNCTDQSRLPYVLAVISRETGQLIGDTGINEVEGKPDEVEIGFSISRAYAQKGYATELVQAMVPHCGARFGTKTLFGRVLHGNQASVRVLEKSGFVFLREEFGAADDPYGCGVLVYRKERL
ncbi:MAG: GNAT family N-acetyltransferase [Clostridia bacterium]|nr:GNAT family N-acetyltransferase [Clostridia bacterium]